MTKGLIILLKPLLQHEIRDAQSMKINLIPYIGHLVRNCTYQIIQLFKQVPFTAGTKLLQEIDMNFDIIWRIAFRFITLHMNIGNI